MSEKRNNESEKKIICEKQKVKRVKKTDINAAPLNRKIYLLNKLVDSQKREIKRKILK